MGELEDRERRCDHCGEVIGVYEPLVVVWPDGEVTRTSLAVPPDAAQHGRVLHAACHARA